MFPTGFVWGAATSAYQIEGALTADGRGRSIWDTFCSQDGRIVGGDTAEIAIDHFNRYREDVKLMADLGLTAYRFSVSWPRIQPDGSGAYNSKGLDFYKRLVDELLSYGIDPWLTLYHWDLPQALEDAGGWPSRDTSKRFADFAATVHAELGDRVKNWSTVNEPWCAAFLGYASGEHAPGRREPAAALRAAHHLNLAHGLAVQAMRAQNPDSLIGGCVNVYPVTPATNSEADQDAARRIDGLQNRFFLDALLKGSYPEDVLADLSSLSDMEFIHDGDLATIAAPIDMLLINYYSRFTVSGAPGGAASAAAAPTDSGSPWIGSEHVGFVNGGRPVTSMGWEVDDSGLLEMLRRISDEYPRIPLYISENGAAYDDVIGEDGTVHDPERVAYIEAHLRTCHTAIESGIPLQGYFAWSLMDNFEWAWGYGKRFGLVYVDYETQARTMKSSALWYADTIRHGGLLGRAQ
ncbi:GH1 family beta-glucosidase [Microbispora hainanensis]|jgi:beta-glucosidase|uniref:Beta-glucosidase n=1 Tax=Microbispora hainanensis TaxID=568844 RepID=A0ABZ1T1F3_9ACTN|nr:MULTISPECIES: GH1 family beta-glucosidase [Microbispora]NJP25880.1 beta-glucosidase [Microbispora sp. CL1-1]TQS13073.1 beta-glucosidase [Microbispora sp. SCL1-1]